ncbi:MAG: hypothetical protein JJD98_02710 [Polaromonas sp.]|nr:hypothetical protein [Polaromonas sp.]
MNANLHHMPILAAQGQPDGKERPGTVRERTALHLFSTASNMQSAQASNAGNHGGAGEVAGKQAKGMKA